MRCKDCKYFKEREKVKVLTYGHGLCEVKKIVIMDKYLKRECNMYSKKGDE